MEPASYGNPPLMSLHNTHALCCPSHPLDTPYHPYDTKQKILGLSDFCMSNLDQQSPHSTIFPPQIDHLPADVAHLPRLNP